MAFDPDKYLAEKKQEAIPSAPVQEAAAPSASAFNPDEYLATKPVTESEGFNPDAYLAEQQSQPSDYGKLRSEMDRGIVEDIAKSPKLISDPVTNKDVAAIAAQNGVSAEELQKWLPFMGGISQAQKLSDIPAAALGTAGNVAFGVPQKLAKLTQSPQMERALDDLQELARARRSLALGAVESLVGPGGVIRSTEKLGSKLLAGAATGAVTGAAAARQGHELMGAGTGAVIGAGLGGVIHGAGKWLESRGAQKAANNIGAPDAESVDRAVRRGGADIEKELNTRVNDTREADSIIGDQIFGSAPLSEADARIVAEAYHPGLIDRLTNQEDEVGVEFWGKNVGKSKEEIDRAAIRQVADDTINRTAKQFASDVAGEGIAVDDAVAFLRAKAGQGLASGEGVDYMKGRLDDMLRFNHASNIIRDRGIQAISGGTIDRALDFLSDVQYVLRGYDEKYRGAGLEDAHKAINAGLNKLSFPREEMRQEIRNIFTQYRKEGVDKLAVDARPIIEKIDTARINKTPLELTPEEQKAYAGFRDFFSRNLSRLNALADRDGLDKIAIKSLDNYIPAQLADSHIIQNEMSDRLNKVLVDASGIMGHEIKDLSQIPGPYLQMLKQDPTNGDTLRFLETLSGGTKLMDGADTKRRYTQTFLTREGNLSLETRAKAALERDDMIPIWARETNLYKLADKWTTNTLRHMYLRKGINQLNTSMNILRKMGADTEAAYVEKLLTDISGVRRGTAAEAFSTLQRTYMQKMDVLARRAPEGSTQKVVYQTLKAMPTMLQGLAKQVYPNLLGVNPRSTIMNMTQTFTKTMPEFGNAYGASLIFRGALARGGLRNLKNYMVDLERKGMAPAKYMGGNETHLAEGIMRSEAAQSIGKASHAVASIIMKPYEWAEAANRSIAWGASKMMASDLKQGSKVANDVLAEFPLSVKRAVDKAKAAGDWNAVEDLIGNHIINSTQYQYNRASMSEFGRTMGPLFSGFTKWPTATLGQSVEAFRSKGLKGGALDFGTKLIAPLALLETADMIMNQTVTPIIGQDRADKLFSKSGLSQSAPIGNLKGIVTGDFFTPPVVDTALKMFIGQSANDHKHMQRALDNGLYMFAPGGLGGLTRFLTDDLVTLYTGQKPEGSTFLEKTSSGLHEMGIK